MDLYIGYLLNQKKKKKRISIDIWFYYDKSTVIYFITY